MKDWEVIEDGKYSDLYENGYPDGDPDLLTTWGQVALDTSILDLGCGNGRLSTIYKNYTGIDVASSVIEINKKKYPDKEFMHCGLSEATEVFKDKTFDTVVCADVIEHLPPDHVVGIIEKISEINSDNFLFGVSTRASRLLAKNGDNLHLTVWPPNKWLEIFGTHYKIVNWQMKNPNLIYIKCHKKG